MVSAGRCSSSTPSAASSSCRRCCAGSCLNYSSAWGEEAARYAFIYLGWIGAAYAVRERAHIRFDIVLQRMGPRGKAVVYLIAESGHRRLCLHRACTGACTRSASCCSSAAWPRCCRSTRPGSRRRCRSPSSLVIFRSLQSMVRDSPICAPAASLSRARRCSRNDPDDNRCPSRRPLGAASMNPSSCPSSA